MYFHVIRKGGKEKAKTAAAWRGWTGWVGYIQYCSTLVFVWCCFFLAFFLWLLCAA